MWAVSAVSLVLATALLPGLWFDPSLPHWWRAPLLLPVEFALLILLLRPVLVLATLPLNAATLGLPTLLINGALLYATARLEPAFHIDDLGDAFIGLALLTVLNTSLSSILGIDEVYPFYQTVLRRLGRRFGPRPDPGVRRGLLILQIDGLSWRALLRAVRRGRMPALSAMMGLGSHRLYRWRSGLPSNTPAVQSGLFYGDRSPVPGYRWYDRRRDRIMVASRPHDLLELERELASRHEGLLQGGSVVNSLLAGGAAKRLVTLATMRRKSDRQPGEQADFNLFWLSPYAYTTAMLATLWDFATALVWGLLSRFHRRKRLIRRTLRMAATRAVGNALLREAAFFWLEQDISRGMPVIYSNFVGYDEVAHQAGPESAEALATLTAFDRKLQRLRRLIRRDAPIPYDILLMSDHGQSASVPFRSLYGRSLEDLVTELAARAEPVREREGGEAAYLGALSDELASRGDARRRWLGERERRALDRIREPLPGREQEAPVTTAEPEAGATGERAPLIVCVSGCLAHIYLRGSRRPLRLHEVAARYPSLVDGLVDHPGIGFVAGRGEDGRPILLGAGGLRDLATGEVLGDDPLAPFWEAESWTEELRRLVLGENAGDLVVNGAWRMERQEVVVFEEQIGSHGGLGGHQTAPFLFLPRRLGTVRDDLRSPEALHRHLRRQLAHWQPAD